MITSQHGLYRFIRMPFGLEIVPTTVQVAMDVFLLIVKGQFAPVYLEDILIFSKSVLDHLSQLCTVLALLLNADVSLKLNKYIFFNNRIKYLSHLIKPGKLAYSDKVPDSIRRLKQSTNLTELKSFCSLFVTCFVASYVVLPKLKPT